MLLALAILPIALTIACGYAAKASGALAQSHWDGVNALSFKLLIPVVLIKSIALSDLSSAASAAWIWSLLATLTLTGLAAFSLRGIFDQTQLPNPSFTTLFQTTTRWNAFIALAAAEQFLGPNGLATIAIGMAVLIPTINVANIVVLAVYGAARTSVRRVVETVVRNPLVQGCAIGLALNFAQVPLPTPLVETLDLVGRAALGVGLMAVGAGIGLRRLLDVSWKMWSGVVLRLFLCPALFLLAAKIVGLGVEETLAGVLIFAVPAAANGYVIARQMGGDADLYADVLTWQTILSLALLPALVMITHAWF